MNLEALRQGSLRHALARGYRLPPSLPLLSDQVSLRDTDALIDRCLVLHAVLAVSYGFSPAAATAWLDSEALNGALSSQERGFLLEGSSPASLFHGRSEAVWALMWVLGLSDSLDFQEPCPNELVLRLPNLKIGESAANFRASVRGRQLEEVAGAADLAYCLHWIMVDAAANGARTPGLIAEWMIVERRRALDWSISAEDWDDISLDT